LREIDQVLGILPDAEEGLDADVEALLRARLAARAAGDWAESDRIRDQLAAGGIVVEDTRDGQRWRRGLGPNHA
jgi:cysteinyl-tRNA synthetase